VKLTSDVAVDVQERGEALQLLTNDEALQQPGSTRRQQMLQRAVNMPIWRAATHFLSWGRRRWQWQYCSSLTLQTPSRINQQGAHQGGEHGHAAVGDLSLAPALDLLDGPNRAVGARQQVRWVKQVWEGVADAGQRLGVCVQESVWFNQCTARQVEEAASVRTQLPAA